MLRGTCPPLTYRSVRHIIVVMMDHPSIDTAFRPTSENIVGLESLPSAPAAESTLYRSVNCGSSTPRMAVAITISSVCHFNYTVYLVAHPSYPSSDCGHAEQRDCNAAGSISGGEDYEEDGKYECTPVWLIHLGSLLKKCSRCPAIRCY